MPKEWTDEEVADEINKAVQIVRADKIDTLIRNRLSTTSNNPPNPENNPPPSGGNPNPDNGGNPATGGKKNKSLWWGEVD